MHRPRYVRLSTNLSLIARTALLGGILGGIFAGVLAGTASPQDAKPLKVTKSLAKRWVKDFVGRSEKRREKARAGMLRATPETRSLLFDALANRPFVAPKKKKKRKAGAQRVEVKLDEAPDGKGEFLIQAPKRSRKPAPAVIRMHGSGGTGERWSATWPSLSVSKKWIAITPTIPSGDRLAWNQPGGTELLDKAYRYALEHYNVDPDRFYVEGYSAGGGAATRLAQIWPQRFAGFYSRARTYDKYHVNPDASMRCAKWVPGFCVVGLNDKDERVKGYRDLEAFYKKENYTGVFRFVENRGHEYVAEIDADAFAFLAKHTRKRYPKSFHALFYKYNNANNTFEKQQYWLRGIDFNPSGGGTPCDVSVEGNTVTIAAPNLKKADVFLNDEIVDLDKPVTIKLDGETVFEGTVERDVGFLLDGYSRDPDVGRLYWNKVTIERKTAARQ